MPLVEIPVTIAFDCDTKASVRSAPCAFVKTLTLRYDTDADSLTPAWWCGEYPPRPSSRWEMDESGFLVGMISRDIDREFEKRAEASPEMYRSAA